MTASEMLTQIEKALGYVELGKTSVAERLKRALDEITVLNAKANITCEAGAAGEAVTKCGRCGEGLNEEAETCFYCYGHLCCDCWDQYGHCGHPEADAMNERARAVAQPREILSTWTSAQVSEVRARHRMEKLPIYGTKPDRAPLPVDNLVSYLMCDVARWFPYAFVDILTALPVSKIELVVTIRLETEPTDAHAVMEIRRL